MKRKIRKEDATMAKKRKTMQTKTTVAKKSEKQTATKKKT